MPDLVDPRKRSQMMSGISNKNTRMELLIRKALFKKGFRYRLHCNTLPGKPDLYLPKYQAAIFINGCFWHGHDCHLFKWPKTRQEFWKEKILSNKRRDAKNYWILREQGIRVLVLHECAIRGKSQEILDNIVDIMIDWLYDKKKPWLMIPEI